jgi:CheY-like chemotaxis protein
LRALAKELNLAEHRERKRLSDELHDHLQQMLVLGKLKLAQGKRVLQSNPPFEKLIEETDAIFSDALKYTRTLVAELSPPALRDHGLLGGLQWLAEYMKKHDIMVTVSTPGINSLNVPEDQAVLLFQCIRELLVNSSKHAGTQEAWVNIVQCDGQLVIEVGDNGAGFDLAAAAAAAAAAADSPSGGVSSKYGLFSIRERMRAVGGSFDMESQPGKGTRATLMLPFGNATVSDGAESTLTPQKKGQPVEAAMLAAQISAGSKNIKIRVLVVDDHAMVRQGLTAVLESYGDLEIVGEASDGQEAIEATERLDPDVVIMDMNMPNMNGIEATSRIKSQYPPVRVIGLSVNADRGNHEKMRAAGASHLLTKEAAVEHLYYTILGRPQYIGLVGEEPSQELRLPFIDDVISSSPVDGGG